MRLVSSGCLAIVFVFVFVTDDRRVLDSCSEEKEEEKEEEERRRL